MRTVLISLATAASALVFASPASAQWGGYGQPQGYGYGYGQPQGYGYGYGQPQGYGYGYYGQPQGYGFGQVRALQARIDGLQRLINRLDRRDAIRDREANRLRASSREIERRLHRSARFGLHPQEAYSVQRRIARLEQRIHYVLSDGRRWGRHDRRWNNFWTDYEREGRHDRWDRDDDDRDGRWDRDDDDRDDRRGRRGRDRD